MRYKEKGISQKSGEAFLGKVFGCKTVSLNRENLVVVADSLYHWLRVSVVENIFFVLSKTGKKSNKNLISDFSCRQHLPDETELLPAWQSGIFRFCNCVISKNWFKRSSWKELTSWPLSCVLKYPGNVRLCCTRFSDKDNSRKCQQMMKSADNLLRSWHFSCRKGTTSLICALSWFSVATLIHFDIGIWAIFVASSADIRCIALRSTVQWNAHLEILLSFTKFPFVWYYAIKRGSDDMPQIPRQYSSSTLLPVYTPGYLGWKCHPILEKISCLEIRNVRC